MPPARRVHAAAGGATGSTLDCAPLVPPPACPCPSLPACSKTWTELNQYQNCEHTLQTYIIQLQPFKKSLPKSILRDFKC
jgi:hypothetical protein